MFKAITLLETLISLVILCIALYFIQPSYFYLADKTKIDNEANLIQSFIYQVQNYARATKSTYHISIANAEKRWCIIAVQQPFAKNQADSTTCNCLNLSSCALEQRYFYYEKHFNNIEMKSNSLYPALFMRINGASGNLESKCLALKSGNESVIIGFDAYGVISVPTQNKRSECKKLI